jgi:F-type H+-transporting ATPase subunit b
MTASPSPDVLGSLGINGKLFLAQLVNVGLILLVMWRWVYKPLLKTIDARDKKIRDGLRHADEASALAEQARDVLAAVKQQAEELRVQEQVETQRQIAKQLQAAEEKMRERQEAMLASIRGETMDLVLRVTERVLAGAGDVATQKALAKQAIEELNDV